MKVAENSERPSLDERFRRARWLAGLWAFTCFLGSAPLIVLGFIDPAAEFWFLLGLILFCIGGFWATTWLHCRLHPERSKARFAQRYGA